MQKISSCLWFDNQAEEAAKFYVSVFKNSKIKTITHYGEGAPLPKGTVLTVSFELDGHDYLALNGGPEFKFSSAISFIVKCKTQDEIDNYWEKLSQGGEKGVCGWLTDKYGLSWQVVPEELEKMLSSVDELKTQNLMNVIMQMKKLDIKKLQEAFKHGELHSV